MFPSILPGALQYLLASLLWTSSHTSSDLDSQPLVFELRHQHGIAQANSSRIVFADVKPSSSLAQETYTVGTRRLKTHKPASQSAFFDARLPGSQQEVLWDETGVMGPDINDRETLLLLAKMTNNAYSQPSDKDWYDLGPNWNNSYPFGWEPDADGFRGHIFATPDNSTVVISIKGTSAGWLVGGGGPTPRKDKLNDNLLFSCCCARVGPTWSTVCPCYQGSYKCDQSCLERSLVEESLFYPVGTNLYYNVSYMYPDSNIWVVGHSLGGALASLVGVTFGAPVVAFEAPAERLAAKRLHLSLPPSIEHVTHVYNTADPIAMGTCNGVSSACAIGGFAMETRCHLGKVLRYDTVTKLKWGVSVQRHAIAGVINDMLSFDWDDDEDGTNEGKPRRTVPKLTEEEDCVDCFNWDFGDFGSLLPGNCTYPS